MKQCRNSIVFVLLVTFFSVIVTPAAPAYAFSLSDVMPKASQSDTSSGSSLMNLILGLLLGKFLDKSVHSGNTATTDQSKVLGGSAEPSGSKSSATGAAIITTAKKYLGVPYVFGGETTAGWDCSAFTQHVMQENGITLPRTAAEQFAIGTPVDKANLQAGDLVFFTTYKPGASHVGFYMGDGNFIHASSAAGKVAITPLNSDYYVQHYIGARRYIAQ